MSFRCSIIGSKGYLGSHLGYYLKRKGITPILYDIVEDDNKYYKKIDMTNPNSLSEINLDVDYIFMFAGLTGTFAGFDSYHRFVKINELSLLNLLDCIRKSEFRPHIIFPSSRLVYRGTDKPLKEDDEKETRTVYAANKIACENYLYAYYNSFGIPYTVFRICVPYGNLVSSDYSFGTIGFFINQAKSGRDISLYGDGNVKRTFTHIEDLCFQVVEGAFHDNSSGQVFNVGGETMSLHDAAQIIANVYGRKVIDTPWPEQDFRIESGNTFFDDSKIKSLLNINSYKKLLDFTKDL